MKKIISVILSAVILVMSVFSVNAFAQETTDEQFSKEFEVDASFSDGYENIDRLKLYYKDYKLAFIVKIPLMSFIDITMKFILKDDKVYILFPSFQLFYIELSKSQLEIPDLPETNITDEWTILSTEEKSENGKTYKFVKYLTEEGHTYEVIFENDVLVKSVYKGYDEYGNYSETTGNFVSYEVSDSVFEIPWYSIKLPA